MEGWHLENMRIGKISNLRDSGDKVINIKQCICKISIVRKHTTS